MKRVFDVIASGLGRVCLSPLFAFTSLASIRYRNGNELLAEAEDPDLCYIRKVMPDKLKIDLEYVDRASLLTDIGLIFATFKEIITK